MTAHWKNIKISWTHHTGKSPWCGLSPKKIKEMRHAPIPAFLAQKSSLLPSHYTSSPAASSPHPLAVSPVFFQSPNCDLDQKPIPKCCDFSVYKESHTSHSFLLPLQLKKYL